MAAAGINGMAVDRKFKMIWPSREKSKAGVCPIADKNRLAHFTAPEAGEQFKLAHPSLSIPHFRFFIRQARVSKLSKLPYLQTGKIPLRIDFSGPAKTGCAAHIPSHLLGMIGKLSITKNGALQRDHRTALPNGTSRILIQIKIYLIYGI